MDSHFLNNLSVPWEGKHKYHEHQGSLSYSSFCFIPFRTYSVSDTALSTGGKECIWHEFYTQANGLISWDTVFTNGFNAEWKNLYIQKKNIWRNMIEKFSVLIFKEIDSCIPNVWKFLDSLKSFTTGIYTL